MSGTAARTDPRTLRSRESSFLVEIDRFQGPMDLLLHLIRHQDIDIFDIPIAKITDQFLQAIRTISREDLDGAGEFLEMAATLIHIKARMLLPRHGEDQDEDPRAELVRRLLEYEQIREVALRLSAAEAQRARCFQKGFIPARPRPSLDDVPLETTWEEVFHASLGVKLPEVRILEHRVTSRLVAMEDKIELILGSLATSARIEFRKLTRPWKNRMHEVMTLLAGLELTRRRSVRLRQASPFTDLWLYRGEGGGEGDGATEDRSMAQDETGGAADSKGRRGDPARGSEPVTGPDREMGT